MQNDKPSNTYDLNSNKMAKDPAFLFYSKDFFLDMATVSFEDRGRFMTLWCVMHQQGRLKEEKVKFLVGTVSDELKTKFKIDEQGLWYNDRLEELIENRKGFVHSRRLNGLKGGRPKKANGKPIDNANDNLPANANGNEDDLNKDRTEFEKLWDDFIGMRNEKGKPVTVAAERILLKTLEECSKSVDEKKIKIIEQSIANGWSDFYPLSEKRKFAKGDETKITINKIIKLKNENDKKI